MAPEPLLQTVKVQSSSSLSNSISRPLHGPAAVVPCWWRMARLWFAGQERWVAGRYALASLLLSIGSTWLLVRVSYAQSNLQTSMADKDPAAFYRSIWVFVSLIAFAAPLFALSDWNEQRAALEWRRWLTQELLTAYWRDRAFYKLKQLNSTVDNPDQRIADDVRTFTDASVTLLLTGLRKLLNCIAFLGVLYRISPSLVVLQLSYAAIGTWLSATMFGKRLMHLSYRMLQQEGNFRFLLLRVRENAESIAFYNGEPREAAGTERGLGQLVEVARQRLQWSLGFGLWGNIYGYATFLVPALLMAPRYFRGEIEFGTISQVTIAFRAIDAALGIVVDNFEKFANLAAEAERLDGLMAELQRGTAATGQVAHVLTASKRLSLSRLTVATPTGRVLTQGLDLQLGPGQSLLVVGPSGCGKSSLLRAIAGLWSAGGGTISSPLQQDMFFLPQQPYMPLGTVRQQLLFPNDSEDAVWLHRTSPPSDEDLLALLEEVRLAGLVERLGGFDAQLDFSGTLSLGEQQRVAFMRLLLHQPQMAFLDEATGALDAAAEATCYKLLQQGCSSFVSVGHRMQLCEYHTEVLEHQGSGQWRRWSAEDFRASLQHGEPREDPGSRLYS